MQLPHVLCSAQQRRGDHEAVEISPDPESSSAQLARTDVPHQPYNAATDGQALCFGDDLVKFLARLTVTHDGP
eukprot:11164474-Lingulodinium_polyedra.AAC.1